MYIYFALKIIAVAHDNNWALLNTPYGHWFLVELLGFVLLPIVILSYGFRNRRVGIVRFGAFYAVLGILLNRINVSIVAFNWNLPGHLHHIVPPWQEVAIVATIVTLHILVFRWIVNRMPVVREEKGYHDAH
jgi:Ni/Fe-hydrogenase subunit HybB-like protein